MLYEPTPWALGTVLEHEVAECVAEFLDEANLDRFFNPLPSAHIKQLVQTTTIRPGNRVEVHTMIYARRKHLDHQRWTAYVLTDTSSALPEH